MNLIRLTKSDIQNFIKEHEEDDPHQLMLASSRWPDLPIKSIVAQIQSRRKAKKKLPKWYNTSGIIFPQSIYLEQSSSEKTAEFKAAQIIGKSLLDLTGGTGVDCSFFAANFDRVVYNESNEELLDIARHNFNQLGIENVSFIHSEAEEFLRDNKETFDWVYIDPSRRQGGQKVFRLPDCQPDVINIVQSILESGSKILLKLSPLLDISEGIREIKNVSKVLVISVDNDCKELLFQLELNKSETTFEAINITNSGISRFEFVNGEEPNAVVNFGEPLRYLYEPNASVLKLGAFKLISEKLGLSKLNPSTHLYTSAQLLPDFPGRVFRIMSSNPFNWKDLKRWNGKKANITIRNFPHTVEAIRKKVNIKEGGNVYLFFATSVENKLRAITCEKI